MHSRGGLGLNDHNDDRNMFASACVDVDAGAGAGASAEKSVKLFGVKLIDYNPHMGMMRKSVSMGNLGLVGFSALQRRQESMLTHAESVMAAQEHSEAGDGIATAADGKPQQGYVSDGLMQTSSMCLRERKKGVPWTEEEHRLFLAGLQTLGKGDWRGISRNFVTSRTPTQVASHAQKYFLRQCNLNKRKRRSSLFDIMSSTMVPTGTNFVGERTQAFASTELNRPTLDLGLRHVMTSSTSLMNSFSPYSKLPSISTHSPTLRADLCLGRPYSQQRQMLADDVSSTAAPAGKQSSLMNTLPSTDFLSSNQALHLDAEKTNFHPPIYTISSLSSSSKSLSSSPSSSSSLCRIDETSELSSLSLSIGPPVSMEASELALKLEQPTITSRHSAILSSARVCEVEEALRAAGAGTVAGNASTVTSMANAISVV